MPGPKATVGTERVSQNGYTYVKVDNDWVLKHHIVAEAKLGRPIDTRIERVFFSDTNKKNFDPDNIVVVPKKGTTKVKRIASLEERIRELQAQLDILNEEQDDEE